MPYSAKRLKEIREEKKAIREEKKKQKEKEKKRLKLEIKREKNRIKAEKEKQKKKEKEQEKKRRKREKQKLKTIERHKMLRKKYNRTYYLKRTDAIRQYRKDIGDEYGYYMIILTKNRKRIKRLGATHWRSDSYNKYSTILEENNNKVKFPATICTLKNEEEKKKHAELIYELLLVKSIKQGENNISKLMNKDGKFVDNMTIGDKENHIIIKKDVWLVEETFAVYGYHPKNDRKTYQFICDNLILNKPDIPDEMKRIMIYNNKLLIENINDFDFVICKNKDQCYKLYELLEKTIQNLKKKYIVFMGEITNKTLKNKWINRIQEKTGWSRNNCKKTQSLA